MLLREHFPDLKIRFVNVVDLYRLVPSTEHPMASRTGTSTACSLKTNLSFSTPRLSLVDSPLDLPTYQSQEPARARLMEKGNINTPLDLAIQNQIDRFSLAIDVIDRVPALQVAGAHAKEILRTMQIDCQNYAYEHGIDKPEVDQWTWPD